MNVSLSCSYAFQLIIIISYHFVYRVCLYIHIFKWYEVMKRWSNTDYQIFPWNLRIVFDFRKRIDSGSWYNWHSIHFISFPNDRTITFYLDPKQAPYSNSCVIKVSIKRKIFTRIVRSINFKWIYKWWKYCLVYIYLNYWIVHSRFTLLAYIMYYYYYEWSKSQRYSEQSNEENRSKLSDWNDMRLFSLFAFLLIYWCVLFAHDYS